MFKIGEYIVYKKEVCKISDKKEYGNVEYFVLNPMKDNSLTINVPSDNKLKLMRKLISKTEVERIISLIPSIEVLQTNNEKNIEQEYKQLLINGNYEDLIKIIKTTYSRNNNRIKNNKKIGEKDEYYFNMVERMLYNEFSVVLGKSFEETKEYVISKVANTK